MFKKENVFLFLPLLALCLTSCFNDEPYFKPYENYIDLINTKYEVKKDNYYKLKEYKQLEYKALEDTNITHKISTFRDIYSNANNGRTYLNMPSIGELNILVLPVSFKDSKKENMDQKKINIQNAIFGQEDRTVHESLASYYNKSSFGNLKIKGEVYDFFQLDMTSQELSTESMGSETAVAKYVTCLAYQNWLKDHEDEAKKYDNDNDGYIDGVMTVYDYPFSYDEGSLYWAFVDHLKKDEIYNNVKINQTDPALSTYAWISYDFLKFDHGVVDVHVFIHEFGHILGLQDYYSKGDYQPLGFMDMMDYNLGDHNAFSKMLLNWTTPYVVTAPGDIEIRPSYNSGDCILIPSGEWNGTPYDEFILLEFYAPEGVNYYDTRLSFKYNNSQGEAKKGNLFTNYGIKAYHVDSRIGYLENKLVYGNPIALIDDPNIDEIAKRYKEECEAKNQPVRYCVDFPFTNALPNHPYIKMVEAKGKNTLPFYNSATNESLFQVGDDMGIDTLKDFRFYDGSRLPFAFKVKQITPNKASITFSEIN